MLDYFFPLKNTKLYYVYNLERLILSDQQVCVFMYGHVCGVRLCLYACVYACAYLCVCMPREVGRSARMQPCDTGVPRPLRPFAIPSATRAAADRAAAALGSTRLLPRALPPPRKEIDGGSAQSHFLTPRRRPLRGQQNSNPIPFIQHEKKNSRRT